MLPTVMDAPQFQAACGLDSSAFAQYAVTGQLPKAVGLYNGAAIWEESSIRQFAELAGLEWRADWKQVAAETQTVPVTVDAASKAPEAPEAPPIDRGAEVYTQADAALYLEVAPGWIKKQDDAGILSGERFGGFKLYRRADLDALKTLPVYKFRKRHGYSHGRPIQEKAPKSAGAPMATQSDFLGETAAADFLNIPRETLALARNDGGGPVCVYSNGHAKYRVADLEAWRDQHAPQRKVAQVVRSTTPNMTASAAAKYLGITPKQLENLLTHDRPGRPAPEHVRSTHNGRTMRLFSAQALEDWKRANSARHAQLQEQGGRAAGRKPALGTRHADHVKAAPAPAPVKAAEGPTATKPKRTRGKSKTLGNVTARLEKAPPKPTTHKRPTPSRVAVRA